MCSAYDEVELLRWPRITAPGLLRTISEEAFTADLRNYNPHPARTEKRSGRGQPERLYVRDASPDAHISGFEEYRPEYRVNCCTEAGPRG
jgi:hypothetical protein